MIKIACSTLACPDWPLGTILERLAAYGYDAVDFRGLGDEMAIYRLEAFSSGAAATAEKIARAGLAVSAFSSGARMFQPDPGKAAEHLAEVVEYARLCGAFGAPVVRVFGGAVGRAPHARAVETSVAALRRMADAVGPDVTLAVETHDDWIHTAALAEVVGGADRPNVGVLWDLHHPYRMAGESPRQSYDNIGAMTVATHVKDSRPTGDGEHEYCLPGQGGDVPLAEMVALLAGAGYDGYLTLEWEKKWHPEIADPDVALPAYARFMKKMAAGEAA
jgi:sugar phosphate isomerase/epimerase